MLRRLSGLSVVAIVALSSAAANAALVITEAMSSSLVTADWVEITNTGATAVDITGYKIDDSSFSAAVSLALNGVTSIPANSSAIFIETNAPAIDIPDFRTYWGGAVTAALIGSYTGSGVGLSSGGDGVTLFDAAGIELPGVRVSFGAATGGSSFIREGGALDGNFGSISAIGTAGAYQSASATPSANIGSPGIVAVPEPTSLLALAAVAMTARRRRF